MADDDDDYKDFYEVKEHQVQIVDTGNYYLQKGLFYRADDLLSKALELKPEDQHCLVARSRCHLFEGEMEKALQDAETSLSIDKKYPKGLLQKAEVYYIMGEFEKALILYHRGQKLRPEMESFRLGIQKCEEAILNSVGDPDTIKLKLDCDLTYFYSNAEKKTAKKQNDRLFKKKTNDENKKKKVEVKKFEANQGAVKKLLGELYADREFLEKLLQEEESLTTKTENSEEIRDLTVNGLNYLHSRCDFWQQQKPMYARTKKSMKEWTSNSRKSSATQQQKDIIKFAVRSINEIEAKQSNNDHKSAIKQAESLLKQIDKWKEADLPERSEILANIYCQIGNSHLELNQFEKAIKYHKQDQELGKKFKLEEAQSRSIDNIGRVYAKQGKYEKAIEIWEQKIPKSQSALESTWLHHEIGRCYLELGEGTTAAEFGEKAVEFAREAEEDKWQMNAFILVAQAASLLKTYSDAIENFEKALEISKLIGNKSAEDAIKNAIEDVNHRIIQEGHQKREKEKKKGKGKSKSKNKKHESDSESEHGKEKEHEDEEENDSKEDEEIQNDEPVEEKKEKEVENVTDREEHTDEKEKETDVEESAVEEVKQKEENKEPQKEEVTDNEESNETEVENKEPEKEQVEEKDDTENKEKVDNETPQKDEEDKEAEPVEKESEEVHEENDDKKEENTEDTQKNIEQSDTEPENKKETDETVVAEEVTFKADDDDPNQTEPDPPQPTPDNDENVKKTEEVETKDPDDLETENA